MKNKPVAHKTSNRFHFKSFNEQLASVEIKYGRHELKHRHLYEDSEESKFLQTLSKWEDLNCTQDFFDLKCKIGPTLNITTLAQIVHRKDHLIDTLKNCLSNPENKAIEVALELLVALAFDLRNEFYPYFLEIFDLLINLLNIQDPNLLENVFMCLAYMFKSLWRYILNDFRSVLIRFSHKLLAKDRKEYIKNFAAQSFSFLMRKVEDKEALIELIFGHLKTRSELSQGFGILFFETVKGVHKQLHSSSSKFLEVLIRIATNERWCESDNIFASIKHCFDCLSKYLSQQTSEAVWTCLSNALQKSENGYVIGKLCELLMFMIQHKDCSLVYEPEKLLCVISAIINVKNEANVNICLDCASTLITKLHSSISLKSITNFMKSFFSSGLNIKAVNYFVESMVSYVFFERDILPHFLPCFSSNFNASSADEILSSLQIIVRIIINKCPRPLLGSDLTCEVYALHFPKLIDSGDHLTILLLNIVENSDFLPLVWCALLCLPHVKPNNVDECCKAIINRLKSSIARIKSEENENQVTVTEYIILESVFALYILGSHSMFDEVPCTEFVTIFRLRSSSVVMLQAFDFYLQSAKRFVKIDALDLKHFESVFDELKINLSSPVKSVRLLTLHIAVLFNPPLPPTESADFVRESVFQICLNAEMLPLSVEQCREKLRLLQKIECGANSSIIPIEAISGYSYELIPIYFLFGTLYSNFSLLWSPINNVIDTYTRSLKNFDDFWRLILEHYSQTLNYIKEKSNNYKNNFFNALQIGEIFDKFYENTYRIKEDRADHYNHRILILKLLKSLSDLMEKKNRDFIQWFFEFLENETTVINIKRSVLTEDITLEAKIEYEENATESNTKMLWKTLVSFLEVFSKFRNPKAMYKEKEVRLVFDSLLQHRDNVLQKTTFDCILAYEFPFLNPYKENFQRLIDNKTFKSEIVNFNLNPSNEEDIVIKYEHRNDLMPYLMRILYGKMLSKTGTNTGGHSKSTLRRSIVFRFLAGCPENELRLFFNLAFSSLSDVFSLNLNSVAEYYTNIDLRKCVPIRILLSSMKTLEVMLFSLGNISKTLLPDFLKILIAMGSIATNLLRQRNLIKEAAVSKLKVLRGECLKIAAKFYEEFDEYNYSTEEIDVFFKCIIWPLLPLFSNESLSSPSPLLKLFVLWSENPRYFVLLMKTMTEHNGLYPLHAIMDLYVDRKCHQSVVEVISSLIVNLLTLENFDTIESESGETVEKLKINNDDQTLNEIEDNDVNYGVRILSPFIAKIVDRLKLNFDERFATSKKKKCLMTSDELTILTRMSPFVKDEVQCKTLAKLLVGTFSGKQRRSQESDCQALHTIYSLLKETSTADEDFIIRFIPLFRFISERNARLELCNILSTVVANEESFALLGNSISMINSFNPRNPEEPDYGLRMEGLKFINGSLDAIIRTENYQILNLLLYNCCFFISFVDDLGVREVSSDLIQCIVQKLNENYSRGTFVKVCIETLFLKEIRVGLRHKNENVRHEFLSILSTLIKTCYDKNPLLGQLYLLCNDDDELDFYTTIKHIQLHRRSRTLSRFVRDAEVLEKLSSKVLSSYILPVATSFLFDSNCRKNSGLIDASIEAVGTICRHIEWPIYNRILTHYLDLLTKDYENHKMIVKILSAILNNFAFDLSDAINSEGVKDEPTRTENILKPKPALAAKIYDCIVNQLLPKLHKHLHSFSRADYEYDAMKDEYPEDNEIQRVPLAFAIVKLLQALPEKSNLLESNIPSVFLRLLHFLKSKSESIRETARNSLIKVMQALGARFFPYLLREMQSMLKKGYQVHVLTYTLNSIVSSLQSQLKPGDFDPCLSNIVDICIQEIFSDFSEEKEVSKIVSKVKEARKSKSFDTFSVIACFASEQSLTKLISPLKDVLSESHSYKILRKVSRCLQKVIIGLTENQSLSESSLLTFFYGIVHNSIPELLTPKHQKVNTANSNVNSTYLLLQKPARKDTKKKTKINSNQFILVQESLRILHILLKKDRLKSENADHLALLEPYVPILSNFVLSDHPKLTTMALKCLNFIILRFSSLQSFKTCANTIKNDLFVLMHKHTGVGMQHGDNYELVIMVFKTMHYLISEIDCLQLDEKQLEVLLVYVEKDIYENSKQAVAFSMLKAIISRRLQSPALAVIMKKLSEMLVQSEQEYVRKQSVQIWMRYLLDFPHGKNLKNHLMFFLRQLDYEYETGRLAVLELLMSVVSRFPDVAFNSYIDLIFIPVASRLINEESTNARKSAADILIKLLQRSDSSKRNVLFEDVMVSWFQQKNVLQQQLAARLCLLLADVEHENFKHRINTCVPLICESLKSCVADEDDTLRCVTQEDHLVYHLLLLFLRMLKINPTLVKHELLGEDVLQIMILVTEKYLLHSHVWVRVVSVDIFEFVFSRYTVEEVVTAIVQPCRSEQYLLNDACSVVWNLCLKFLDLLRDINDCENLANSLIRNMVFIGKVVTRLPEQWESSEETKQKKMNIKWLIKRMLREIRREVSENDKCCVKRLLIFKWIAAIVLELKNDQLSSCLEILLTPLCREVTKIKNEENSDLIILAKDVMKVIQGTVGKELYAGSYAKVVSTQSRKRMYRKNQRAIELIMNPLKGLKRKHKKHVSFRENKKRKIAQRIGKKAKRSRV